MDWCMAAFSSTTAAMAAQRALRGICPAVVMPVLRQVSASCGIALRLRAEDAGRAWKILSSALGTSSFALYSISVEGSSLRCEPLPGGAFREA